MVVVEEAKRAVHIADEMAPRSNILFFVNFTADSYAVKVQLRGTVCARGGIFVYAMISSFVRKGIQRRVRGIAATTMELMILVGHWTHIWSPDVGRQKGERLTGRWDKKGLRRFLAELG